jgi:hypothetical protein
MNPISSLRLLMFAESSAESCFITSPIWQSVDQTSRRTFRRLAQSLALSVPARGASLPSLPSVRHQPPSSATSSIPYHLSKVERALPSSNLSVDALKSFIAIELGDGEAPLRPAGGMLSSLLSSSRLDLNSSRGASPEAGTLQANLSKWVSLLVAVRQHAILMLDGLAYMYCLQQAALR